MAIGLAKIFGYDLGENFNFPYISRSISEFWRRWHISLGNWFREYLYFPLGGSRRGNAYINLLIVFVVTGVWHGANWTFILWGLWHGILRVTEKIVEKTSLPYKIPGVLKWLSTMLAVVLGWVVFRSSSIKEATDFIKVMFGIKRFAPDSIIFSWKYFLNNRLIFLGIIGFFGATFFKKSGLFDWWSSLDNTSNVGYFAIQTIVIVGLAGLSIMMVLTSRHMPFLYLQF